MEIHKELLTETEDIEIVEELYLVSTNNNLPTKKPCPKDLKKATKEKSFKKLGELDKKLRALLLHPFLRRMICSSIKFECVSEVLVIAAMETEFTLSYRMAKREKELDKALVNFHVVESDHLSLLRCYQAWKSSSFSKDWCDDIGLDFTIMQNVIKFGQQMEQALVDLNINNTSCGNNWLSILKCISFSYDNQVAKFDKFKDRFICCRTGETRFIHPNSAIISLGRKPAYVVYHKLVKSNKGAYMRGVTIIENEWSPNSGKIFCKSKNPEDKSSNSLKTVKLYVQIQQVSKESI